MHGRDELEQWLALASRAVDWRDRAELRRRFAGVAADLEALDDPAVDEFADRLFNHPYDSYEPRPDTDDPERGEDQQTAFFESDKLITFALGGNGSGKTYTAAQRCVAFLCERQPPPVRDTPFWILGDTLDIVGKVAWKQKLTEIMPSEWIDWDRISWHNVNQGFPLVVPLKPWPGKARANWSLEFKSYDQQRRGMQGAAIGGAWFTEQFPWPIFDEVLRGIREYSFPGSIWAEFTPLDPERSVEVQDRYEKWLSGDPAYSDWQFCFLSTITATAAGHAQERWFKSFAANVSEEMAATRLKGLFASYRGQIYKSFRPAVHLVPDSQWPHPAPHGVFHKRAVDWGSSEEHPFVCLWGFKDSLGCWWIYDEYWNNNQSLTWDEVAAEITARHDWPEDSPYHQATYGDPSRPDMIREFTWRGIPITPARNAVNEGIERVRELLKIQPATGRPRLYVNRTRCPHLSRQLATYRWHRSPDIDRRVNPTVAAPAPLKRDDDAVDALRYLVFSDYAYETVGMAARRVDPPAKPGIWSRRRGR